MSFSSAPDGNTDNTDTKEPFMASQTSGGGAPPYAWGTPFFFSNQTNSGRPTTRTTTGEAKIAWLKEELRRAYREKGDLLAGQYLDFVEGLTLIAPARSRQATHAALTSNWWYHQTRKQALGPKAPFSLEDFFACEPGTYSCWDAMDPVLRSAVRQSEQEIRDARTAAAAVSSLLLFPRLLWCEEAKNRFRALVLYHLYCTSSAFALSGQMYKQVTAELLKQRRTAQDWFAECVVRVFRQPAGTTDSGEEQLEYQGDDIREQEGTVVVSLQAFSCRHNYELTFHKLNGSQGIPRKKVH